ncbi:hypothetical protein SAMN06264855_104230 [Halorubrum vacuolatum]|uniref:Uncharacterized protein n=1 Tax=Halorubrum vacuolatum TaxID=63740 RepID=A0A238VYR7_HALVU|nr:hypothetical protein SAMN06264855_104230 [Halorubrum vacuolatum]
MMKNNKIVRGTISDPDLIEAYEDYLYHSHKDERQVLTEALRMYLEEENQLKQHVYKQ